MTTFISNLKKRFSIKPQTTVSSDNIQENDDDNEIKKLNNNNDNSNGINNNNNNNINGNGQLKKVYKRKKSLTEDSSDDSTSSSENEDNDNGDGGDFEEIQVKKSVSFKEQPKPTLMSNKQLSAIPKSKRKSIIIQPSTNSNNNNNNTGIDTTTTRDNSINQSLPPIRPKPLLTNVQISELYASCIKLSTENKINQKNSWTLKLIDHVDDVLENQHSEGNTTNFQAASCVLDASVKIYSNRVDSIHVDTYKILGGLSRAERDESKNDDDDDENQTGEGGNKENENSNKNKKKKKKSGVNTLEQNIDNITIKKFDLQFMVDPLFGKTSAAFDEGGAKGLLLNNLSIYGDCKLVFDSNDAIYSKSTNNSEQTQTPKSNNSSKTVDISHWKHLFTPNSNKNLEICPTYCGFSNWSVKSQAGLSFDTSAILKKNQNNNNNNNEDEDNKNNNNNNNDDDNNNFLNMDSGGYDDYQQQQQQQSFVPQEEDEIDLNKLGINNGQDDGDMGIHFGGGDDEFDGVGMGYDDDESENRNNNNNNEDDNLMGILDTNQDWDQLNLVEPNKNQNWTGPEHWKFSKRTRKQINKDGEIVGGDGEVETVDPKTSTKKKRKTTSKKKAFLLDFDSEPPPESMFEPGKGTTLTAASLKKASETSTILPPDIHYDLKMLSRLFNKPKCSIPPMSKRDEVLKFLRPRSGNNVRGDPNGDDDDDDDDDDNGNQDYDFPNSQIIQDDFNPNQNDDYGDFGGGGGGDDDGIGMTWDDDNQNKTNNTQENGQDNNNNNHNNNSNINSNNNTPFTIGLNGGVLIEEPRKVNRIDINYARVSKKIDVKSLKTSVWGLIESSKNNNNNKTTNNDNNSIDENDDDTKESTDNNNNNQQSFGTLIDNLKDEQNQLRLENKPTAGEVSIPLAFICVLHLANEKNLTLNQNNINDFFISK